MIASTAAMSAGLLERITTPPSVSRASTVTGKRGRHELRRLAGRRRFIDLRDQLDRLIAAGDRGHIGGHERFDALCQDSGSRFKAWIEEDRLRVILDPVFEKIRPSTLLSTRASPTATPAGPAASTATGAATSATSTSRSTAAAAWAATARTDGRERRDY